MTIYEQLKRSRRPSKRHGPNVVFHKSINPQEVIDFIEANFDLSEKTGGPVELEHV